MDISLCLTISSKWPMYIALTKLVRRGPSSATNEKSCTHNFQMCSKSSDEALSNFSLLNIPVAASNFGRCQFCSTAFQSTNHRLKASVSHRRLAQTNGLSSWPCKLAISSACGVCPPSERAAPGANWEAGFCCTFCQSSCSLSTMRRSRRGEWMAFVTGSQSGTKARHPWQKYFAICGCRHSWLVEWRK